MRNKILIIASIIIVSIMTVACQQSPHVVDNKPQSRSIYHWKTTFALDSSEVVFLQKHQISKLYLRMFDVATETNWETGTKDVVPIATTRFKAAVPTNIEVIPTTYITLEALREIEGEEAEFAALIVERLLAMSSYNECGEIREVQFDCDWTASTKTIYYALCAAASELLHKNSIELSATIRLHQLAEEPPMVDRGVLMLYNTGALKNVDTKNSILDVNDVKPYIHKQSYGLSLDYAYPVFGWGVKFCNGEFQAIVSNPNEVELNDGETLRKERASVATILEVKQMVEEELGQPTRGNIIYHLDNKQLENYTDDEISQIFTAH